MSVCPSDADVSGFQRLPERVEGSALELGKLVEKQYAQMRKADLAWADAQPTANEGRHGCAVVRRSIRPAPADLATAKLARD